MRVAWIRAVLALSLFGFAALLTSSCVGLLDVDGYSAAIPQLCAKLSECYGEALYPDCIATAEGRLAQAKPEVRAAFLKGFADKSCLENCINVRKCLDADPICGDNGQDCSALEQCCGFSTGIGVCDGACCIPPGAPCSDGGCCDDECIEGTCGGFECTALNDPCEQEGECCGELRCHPVQQLCLECLPDMAECLSPADCCNGFCAIADDGLGGRGVCLPPPCGAPDGAPCVTAEECCGDFCMPAPALGMDIGICNSDACLPSAAPCLLPEECCGGRCHPLEGCGSDCEGPTLGQPCDPVDGCCEGECPMGLCCNPNGTTCFDKSICCSGECHIGPSNEQLCGPEPTPGCGMAGDGCATGLDCCDGICQGNQCCDPVSSNCAHDICTVGTPLTPSCLMDASCITQVCTMLPHCCCTAWDQQCIDTVGVECGMACPVSGI